LSLKPKSPKRLAIHKKTSSSRKEKSYRNLSHKIERSFPDWKVVEERPLGDYTSKHLSKNNQYIEIVFKETKNLVTVADFSVTPKGKGLGTKVMVSLKEYCDKTNKELFLKHAITNWYDKFPWLKSRRTLDGIEHYTYNPEKQRSKP